ncbi:MAG: riboflavin synthase [Proteobacteria bacterium]|nr:riboflavin synthase [Pseudomonadota bacterium]
MFTGIVQAIGTIESAESRGGDVRLGIDASGIDAARRQGGDSVAVAGVCLTVAALTPRGFHADVSRETLALTTIGTWRAGTRVNLEPALRAGDALGGHMVSGHVDGRAELLHVSGDARSRRWRLRVPAGLERYIARKGSVTLDGVSLTVNEVDGREFGVNLIPHTLAVTTLGALEAGAQLNLEIDVMARYIERLAPQ